MGKSYLVRTWGQERFDAVVELNFERDPQLADMFSGNDPAGTIRRLEAYTGRRLPSDGRALLFLDEIQAAPAVLARLRWFAEETPSLPIVAAGSLLDFVLADPAHGVPVGRIGYMHLEPMGFGEFLLALGEQPLVEFLARDLTLASIAAPEAIPAALHLKLLDLFRHYLLVGGMPAAVERYRLDRSLLLVAEQHANLLATFRDDFAKYSNRVHHRRLSAVLDAVPRQLGARLKYSLIDREERAAALSQAVDLLALARVCHKVRATTAEGVPLAAGADDRAYKLIHLDIGLASSALGVSLRDIEALRDLSLANEGAVAEQIVGQLLRLGFPAHQEPSLYYWYRDQRGAQAEVDYVIQHGPSVVPVEVKAGATGSLKSLHVLMAKRGWKTAVRFNADFPSVTAVSAGTTTGERANYRLLSLPLYLVEQVHRLLDELPSLEETPHRRK